MLKKITIFLLIALFIAFAINNLYERYLRPDNLFFSECLEQSRKWEKEIRSHGKPCYIFAGSSEVRMGIEPEVMWTHHGIPAINAGVQAGNGDYCNVQTAIDFLKSGDTLVLSCKPSCFTTHEYFSQAGINFNFKHQGVKIFSDGIIPINKETIICLLCGDSMDYCTYLMRILTRPDCIFRYSSPQNARISKSGRVEVYLSNEQKVNISHQKSTELPHVEGWKELLDKVKSACHKKNANLVIYIATAHASVSTRRGNAYMALHFVNMGFPVLRDPLLGASENAQNFSDTGLHLSVDYGKQYSIFLANLIKNKSYWTASELTEIINKDSSPGGH